MHDMEDRHAIEIDILHRNTNRERQIEEEATVWRCESIISKYRTNAKDLQHKNRHAGTDSTKGTKAYG